MAYPDIATKDDLAKELFDHAETPAAFAAACATYEMARRDAQESVESDEEVMLLGRAHSDATEALMLAPAPNLPALAYKLEAFAAEDCFTLSPQYREPLFAALVDDVRRLDRRESKS